jgi:hypothetical protein
MTSYAGCSLTDCAETGYDIRDRRLVVNREESKLVRDIYKRYLELCNVRLLKLDLDRRRIVSKIRVSKNGRRSGGRSFSRGALYEIARKPALYRRDASQEGSPPGAARSNRGQRDLGKGSKASLIKRDRPTLACVHCGKIDDESPSVPENQLQIRVAGQQLAYAQCRQCHQLLAIEVASL